jgi:pyruvate/2-oxoglutarate dehydrogenase complex dihydrolipoamide acyltransferase (E2) component
MNERLAAQKIRLSLSDFVARAVTVALLDHPALNATFDGERRHALGRRASGHGRRHP